MAYPRSPQWRGGRFENPPEWPKRPGLRDLVRWQLGKRAPAARDFRPPTVDNDGEELRANTTRTSLTWIGHATLLVQLGGVSLLTDPVWAPRMGLARRFAPPGLALAALPRIDVVLVSHNHRDHLDAPTIDQLDDDVQVVVPLGLQRWFTRAGKRRAVELDWWQSTDVVTAGGTVKVTLVPAQHWSQRGLGDAGRTLWGGFVVESSGQSFYFAGDTGYPAAFRAIGERFPAIDYALLPIGAYQPRWFMCPQHIDPGEAALVFRELGARRLVPMHWGTFRLSDEPMDEPPRLLRAALGAHRDADKLLQLAIGETFFRP